MILHDLPIIIPILFTSGNGVVNRGLQILGGITFNTSDAFAVVQAMSIDDSTTAFATGDTALNSGGAVTNFAAQAFDATPTRSSQTISCTTTYLAATYAHVVKRIALHNLTAASVTTSSTSLFGGISGQSIDHTGANFKLAITLQTTLTDNT